MNFLLSEKRSHAICAWVDRHAVTRFVFSGTAMAFAYGIFLFLYELRFWWDLVVEIHPVLIAWATLIATYNFFVRKVWMKISWWVVPLIFAFSAAISVALNADVDLIGNIKCWILMVLPIFAFYPVCAAASAETCTKTLLKTFSGAAAVMFAASLSSLVMYVLYIGANAEFLGMQDYVGISLYDWTNPDTGVILYGIFRDTNHAAMYAAAFAGYSVILFQQCRKGLFAGKAWNRLGQVFALVNLVVQICYFPLANSRGGWLCLGVAAVVVAFFYWRNKMALPDKKTAVKTVIHLLLALGTMAFLLAGVWLAREGMTLVTAIVQEICPYEGALKFGSGVANNFNKPNAEFGAGRLNLWKEGLMLFCKKPVFGGVVSNMQYHALRYGIEGYVAEGKALHNSYLELLVGYGLVGFILLMGFFGRCFVSVLQRLDRYGKTLDSNYYVAAMITLMAAGVMVLLSCAFINTTAMYYLMLVLCGYLAPAKNKMEDQ